MGQRARSTFRASAADDFQGGEALLDEGGKGGIEFDGHDVLGAAEEILCERTFAGADFQDKGAILRASGFRDAPENGLVLKKMLAEFLAGQGFD